MADRSIIGRGWRFPVRPTDAGALPLVGGAEKVRQAIWILLSTAPGERVMRPGFGCGVHELVFQANTSALRAQVRARVSDALLRYEPRIDVIDVRVESAEEERNRLDIHISYRLRSNNAVFNLVFPFFLREGAA